MPELLTKQNSTFQIQHFCFLVLIIISFLYFLNFFAQKITRCYQQTEWRCFTISIIPKASKQKRYKNSSMKNVQNIPRNCNLKNPFFLTEIISRRQKWNSRRQFSKNCIFPNIQLKGVVNRLPPFKNLSDHTNIFLMG